MTSGSHVTHMTGSHVTDAHMTGGHMNQLSELTEDMMMESEAAMDTAPGTLQVAASMCTGSIS